MAEQLGDKPFYAKCRIEACGHIWPIAYLPMDIRKFANATKGARCPRCGDTRPGIAKQDNGILQEQVTA